jgi:hypothetical protein
MKHDKSATPQPTTTACADELPTTNNLYQRQLHAVSFVGKSLPRAHPGTSAERQKQYTSITHDCSLLCPAGCGLQRVTSIRGLTFPLTVITLACGHVRGEILPAKGVSLEHVSSPEGLRLFPPDLIAAHVWGRSLFC